MHSYADTFERPITIKIDEKDITLKLNSQRDYLAWIDELTEKLQKSMKENAPPAGRPLERSRWMTDADLAEVTPQDLRPQVFRGKGTIRVLEIAIKKAGVPDEDAKNFIDSQSVKANEMLAVRVSGLFRKEELAELYPDPNAKPKEQPDPNASVPAAP